MKDEVEKLKEELKNILWAYTENGRTEEWAISCFIGIIQIAQVEAVDDKLKTLAEAVPYLELCEKDSDRILVWVNNHRWSLVAPKGENTQANLKEDGDTK